MEDVDERQIEAVERRGVRSKSETMYMRRSRAQLENALTKHMIEAEFEIERAFRMLAGHMGYGKSDYLRIPGASSEGYMAWAAQQIEYLRQWQKTCHYRSRGIVLDMTAFCFGLKEVCEQRGMDRKTVVKYYRQGLNEYCVIRGWGDQLGE